MNIEEKNHLETLVIKAKDGDKKAKEEILKRYEKIVVYNAAKYFIKGFEHCDLINEGYKALLIAIEKYKSVNCCFHTYAVRTIENRYKYLLRSNKEPKDKESIYITDEINDFLKSDDLAVEDMAYANILKVKIEKLHKDEREVIRDIYIKGKTIKELAKEKGLTYSQVQYIRNRGLTNLKMIV